MSYPNRYIQNPLATGHHDLHNSSSRGTGGLVDYGTAPYRTAGRPGTAETDPKFIDSITTVDSDGSNTTRSTVRTVSFRDQPMTISMGETSVIGDDTPLSQSEPETTCLGGDRKNPSIHVDQLVTDDVIIQHPRSLLILACIQLTVAVQILIFGMICTFYQGCPYLTAIWTSVLFIVNATLGFVFVKLKPRKGMLYAYTATSVFSLISTVVLFAVTAWLLDSEDNIISNRKWEQLKNQLMDINRIVENTKIAMYSLHLILSPVHGICTGISCFILYLNFSYMRNGKVEQGYFVSQGGMGHQTVLVPIELKQVKKMPQNPAEATSLLKGHKRATQATQTSHSVYENSSRF